MEVGREKLQRDVLEHMLEVAQHLTASSSLTEILSVIINAMRDTLDAERATVLEHDAARGELFSTVAHGLGGQTDGRNDAAPGTDEIRIPADSGLAGQCAMQRRIINVPDAYADDRFNREIDKRTGFRTTSVLTVPLLARDGELIGVAQVLNKHRGTFDERDEQVSTVLASLAAMAIKGGRLIEDRLVREKLERDLELARQIQQHTFPQRPPTLTGFDLDAWSEPAEATGGDAVDVIPFAARGAPTAEGALLLLADATGHGIGPALVVTQLRSMLRMASRLATGPGETLLRIAREVNQQLSDDLPRGRFITAWFGRLDLRSGTLASLSAGQAPLLRYDAAGGVFDVFDADTAPLAVSPDLDASVRRIPMRGGDIFAVLSDGIFEATDGAGRQFGVNRVKDVIAAHRREGPGGISAGLRDAVSAFTGGRPATDDRTAIILQRRE